MAITNSTLWKRSFRLTIGDREFGSVDVLRPLEFSFSVQRDKTLTPNNANILIYNLAEDTRAYLEQLSGGFGQGTGKVSATHVHSDNPLKKHPKKPKAGVAQASEEFGVPVRLEVGYGENLGQIFFGVLRKVSSWRQGPNWLTQISGGDAEHSIATAKISKTWVKGTPIASVVKDLVGALPGVGPGSLQNTLAALQTTGYLNGGAKLQRALTAHGDAATALEQVMKSCGMEWSIQDGAFVAGPVGTPTVQGEGPVLSATSGLLDVPQIDKNGKLLAKALLHPDLLPGRVFRVESTRVTGNFLCDKTIHRGDTTGRDWIVEVSGSPPQAGSRAAALEHALDYNGFPVR